MDSKQYAECREGTLLAANHSGSGAERYFECFIIPNGNPRNFIVQQWGTSGDIPVRGDYDGDGTTDFAVWRPSTGQWFVRRSQQQSGESNCAAMGTTGDIPVPVDYDGHCCVAIRNGCLVRHSILGAFNLHGYPMGSIFFILCVHYTHPASNADTPVGPSIVMVTATRATSQRRPRSTSTSTSPSLRNIARDLRESRIRTCSGRPWLV